MGNARMKPMQQRFWPDPQPLVERLGREFFRQLPETPGVYLMHGSADVVLYVGKARSLRHRLSSYRVANPERMKRRTLRLLGLVERIVWEECADESVALRRESELLLSLKPRFNRAGVWPGKPKFIVWRMAAELLELGVVEIPEPGWRRFGPLNGSAQELHHALARLLWLATNSRSIVEMPAGWVRGKFPHIVELNCGTQLGGILAGLESHFWQSPETFMGWLGSQCCGRSHRFERAVIELDMEALRNSALKRNSQKRGLDQFSLL